MKSSLKYLLVALIFFPFMACQTDDIALPEEIENPPETMIRFNKYSELDG